MKAKWIVGVKTDEGYDSDDGYEDGAIEISAIREDNEHGKESWGWEDIDSKIILFGEIYDAHDLPDEKILDRYKRITQKFCDILNEEED